MRIKWIDVARGIAIILVIIGHSCRPSSTLAKAIFSFHMPFFFIISGYFFRRDNNFSNLVSGKAKSLLLPYLTTALIVYGYWLLVVRYRLHDLTQPSTMAITFLKSFVYGAGNVVKQYPSIVPIGPIWFLLALFSANILFFIILKITRQSKMYIQAVLFLLISIAGCMIGKYLFLPWSLDIALASQFFMFSGYVISTRIQQLKDISAPLIAPIFLFWIYDIYAGGISLNNREYNNILISFAGAIAGSLVLLYASYQLSKIKSMEKALSFIGMSTLVILCFHTMDNSFALWDLRWDMKWIYSKWYYLSIFRLMYCLAIGLLLSTLVPWNIYINKKWMLKKSPLRIESN